MSDRGTRNVIFIMRMLSERSIQHQQNVYIFFTDYKKAFDLVCHQRLFKMLENLGLDDKDYRLIYNLYHLQKTRSNSKVASRNGLKSSEVYVKFVSWVQISSTCIVSASSATWKMQKMEYLSTVSVLTTLNTLMTLLRLQTVMKAFKDYCTTCTYCLRRFKWRGAWDQLQGNFQHCCIQG